MMSSERRWLMKRTDFAVFLNKYLTVYLVDTRGSKALTVESYRYAFISLLEYYTEELGISADKICLSDFTYKNISGFYIWLETKHNNGALTRNQRQSAVNSFIRYLMYERPEYLSEFQRILGIPFKKTLQKEISYLKPEGIKLLLKQVPTDKQNGLRDYAMLMLMYTTGIRVSELIGLKVRDVSLTKPCTLLVHGKGGKSRFISLNSTIVPLLSQYLKEMHYDDSVKMDEWLFINHMKQQFTRQGICYLIHKYADLARNEAPDLIPEDMSPHKVRHSTAMSLVSWGVDLIYIRDLLGHVSVKTTEIYARADAKAKREAIEAASKELVPQEAAAWESNISLREWLKAYCKPTDCL